MPRTPANLALLAAASVVVAACEDDPPALREDHRAFFGTAHAVSALSLGRAPSGELLASWMEVAADGDGLRWVPPSDGAAPVHIAHLDESPRTWRVSPLVAVGDGFARFASTAGQEFGELWIGADQGAESFQRILPLGYTATPFAAVGVAGEAVILVLTYEEGVQIWRRESGSWRSSSSRRQLTMPCADPWTYELAPFAAAAWGADEIVLLVADAAGPSCEARLRRVDLAGNVLDDLTISGDLADDATGSLAWAIGQMLVLPQGGLGVLWLARDGRIRVNAAAGLVELALDEPLFDADAQIVASARLVALDDRFAVTYRVDEEGTLGRTQAVVVDPVSADVSEPFAWPLDDGECVDAATVPRDGGADYVCVAPCPGATCGQQWLYRGRVIVR